jgi:hypothetical protein
VIEIKRKRECVRSVRGRDGEDEVRQEETNRVRRMGYRNGQR